MGDIELTELEKEIDIDPAKEAQSTQNTIEELQLAYEQASSEEQKQADQAKIDEKQTTQARNLVISFKLDIADPQGLKTALLEPNPPSSVPPDFQVLDTKLNDIGNKTKNLMEEIAKKNGEKLTDIVQSEEAWKGSKTYKELSDKGMSEQSKSRLWQLLLLALAAGLGYLALWAFGKHKSGCYIVDAASGTNRQLTTDANCNCCNNNSKCDANNACCGISCPSASTACYCKEVSAFDALGDLLSTVVDVINAAGQGIGNLIMKILFYIGIGLAVIFLLWVIIKLIHHS